MDIDSRPIIFYYGENSAVESIKEFASSSLAAHPVEWSRKPGLPLHTVNVDPEFKPFEMLLDPLKSASISTFSHPMTYIYACPNDASFYDKQGYAELKQWTEFISAHNIQDWLVITITDRSKKVSSKLSVVYKLKSDFGIDSLDHLIDLPSDHQSLPSAWHSFLGKLRNSVLRSFSSTLNERELHATQLLRCIGEVNWDFMEYFACQEEIASLYCCLGLYEEALECMDNAEYNLSASIARATEGERSLWIERLLANTCDVLVLTPSIISTFADPSRARRVKEKQANIFELRAHLLSRQCVLLQALDKINSFPKRGVQVIRMVTKEARDLKINVPPTQLYFWTFLCCFQILDTFRRSTPSVPKPEFLTKLRRSYLISTKSVNQENILNSWRAVTVRSSSPANYSRSHSASTVLSPDQQTPSNIADNDEVSMMTSVFSDVSSQSLASARFEAIESLDLLEEDCFVGEKSSLNDNGAYHLLATTVYSSVVTDEYARAGRTIPSHQVLVGTSRWTVELWRRACSALGRLGRCLNLWPSRACLWDPHSDNRTVNADAMLIAMLKAMENLREAPTEQNAPLSPLPITRGSFSTQLSVVFTSAAIFEDIYRKVVNVGIFFLWCAKMKRNSLYTSLNLADFYRDANKFVQAEALYSRATNIFLAESWPELATYSLLQQAFCQKVQWRTENLDNAEASIFKRYVQSAMILSVTPTKTLELCYELFLTKGVYFDGLFDKETENEEGILPPWWPQDWWKETLSTVTEHHQRCSADKRSASLFTIHPPLTVRSLKPLFKLVSVELEEANHETERQMIRVHVSLIGVRTFWAKIRFEGRVVTRLDWEAPPFIEEETSSYVSENVNFFNVGLGGQSMDSTTVNNLNNGLSLQEPMKMSKNAIVRRLFKRSNTPVAKRKDKHRQLKVERDASESNFVNGKPLHRPASIDFLSVRNRLDQNILRHSPLPDDASQDGLALRSEYETLLKTSENSLLETSPAISTSEIATRRHRKVLSLTDCNFMSDNNSEQQKPIPKPIQIVLSPDGFIPNAVRFLPHAFQSHRPFDRRVEKGFGLEEVDNNGGIEYEEDEGAKFLLRPGDNFLMMEARKAGFILPLVVYISIFKESEELRMHQNNDSIVSSSSNIPPVFIFSSPIEPSQFGRTWMDASLLDRLLPRLENVLAFRVPRLIRNVAKPGQVSANVVLSMRQPIFPTIRIGSLAVPKRDADGNSAILTLFCLGPGHTQTPQEHAQRYAAVSVNGTCGREHSQEESVDLVYAPNDPQHSKGSQEDDGVVFNPGSLLCPRRCLYFSPDHLPEKYAFSMSPGRLLPIKLNEVYPLTFTASTSIFQRKIVFVKLRVGVVETTCPTNGFVVSDEREPTNEGKGNLLNPFYHVQNVSFRITAPQLLLCPINGDKAVETPKSNDNASRIPFTRSTSTVSFFNSDSPIVRKTSEVVMDVPHSTFFGNEFDFSEVASLKEPLALRLCDPDRSEGIVSPCCPFAITWAIPQHQFEALLRPTGKPDMYAVAANFSFLAGTLFDSECTAHLNYKCNIVKHNTSSMRKNI